MTAKFHERFGIALDVDEARRRFINRVFTLSLQIEEGTSSDVLYKLKERLATALGERHHFQYRIWHYLPSEDFHEVLRIVEALFEAGSTNTYTTFSSLRQPIRDVLDVQILKFLAQSEVDLDLRWEGGRFWPAGAEEIDSALVRQPLDWMRREGLETVLRPFEKGLQDFLRSQKEPDRLKDVMTEMYESIEALAGIVVDRPKKDLSANRELFIRATDASAEYKRILKEYISYANLYRHHEKDDERRPTPSQKEAESFIYLTGLFVRLAMPER